MRAISALMTAGACMGVYPVAMARAQANSATAHIAAHALNSGTLVLRGNLSSVTDVRMTGAFSVGNAHDLQWDLPRVTSTQENGYWEQIDALAYSFDVAPDSFHDAVVGGHAVRQFVWKNPPTQTVIHVSETFRASVRSDLTPFHSTASYPLRQLGSDVAPYLQFTPQVTLPAGAQALINRLRAGKRTEQAVVTSVINWVAAHTVYDPNMLGVTQTSAAQVLASHRALCRGYDNLAIGILRTMGIPVRAEFGWVSSGRLNLPALRHGSSLVQWGVPGTSGESHAWISVYFPDAGWVPLDPQREKFFVDPNHIAFFSNLDAGTPSAGAWTASVSGRATATGTTLANGSVEVVPGNASSVVTVRATDSIHATLHKYTHDVRGVLLFSR